MHSLGSAAQDGRVRIVGRVDNVEPEALTPQIFERGVEVLACDLPVAQAFLVAFLAGAFLVAGLEPASSLSGFAGLGLADGLETGPFAGSSGTGLGSALPFDFGAAFFAFGFSA